MDRKLPKALTDLPIKQYEAWALLERTQAFQAYRAAHPEIQDMAALRVAFMETPEGDYVAAELDIFQYYQEPISADTRLQPNGRLSMDVDMARPKGELVEAFIYNLDRHKEKHPARGKEAPNFEKIMDKFKVFDLVQKHEGNFLHATWEVYPETNGLQPSYDPDTDKKYKRIIRWYLEVQVKIGDL
jgi:hypothetical protein